MRESTGWKPGTLADVIAALDAGVSVNSEDRPHGAGEIGILKTSALNGGVFQPVEHKAVLRAEQARVAEPVKADSILVSRMNMPALVGESCYVEEAWPELFVPDRIWQLKPKDRDAISMRWLSYVMRSARAREHIAIHATGTSGSMKNLPKSGLLSLPITYPPLPEQVAVASILDTLDTTIRQTEAIIEKLKQVKQGLLHDLLTRGIDANGELRPPQGEAPHVYKKSPVGLVPQSWKILTGRDVCSEIVVGIVIKPTQYYRDAGIPTLRSANVREGGLTLDQLVYMDEKDHRAQQKSCVKPGDVLTVRTGYPGTSCVVDDKIIEANCIDILISRPSANILPSYWALWINSSFGKEQVLRVQGGLAQQHFNAGELAAMLVATPSIDEQEMIVGRLDAMNGRLAAEAQLAAGLRRVKSGLMDDLLIGRVRVTPLLSQPATP